MAHKVFAQSRFINGISDFSKEGLPDTYYFGRCVDHRSDPRAITLLPKTIKESGSVVTDLVKWGEYISGNTYFYGDSGNIYKRTSTPVYSLLKNVPNSGGNGLAYFAEDDYLYYTSDKIIGRYGPMSGTLQFNDDFLGSQGGVPLNTNSLQLLSASSQYASRADTATLSITGDLTLEAYIKPTTLPTSGNTMVLVSKWDESGATRSYRFDIGTTSAAFGTGSDGAYTISSNTTRTETDSACAGTVDTYTLTATNASFAAGQEILIHQTQGTGAGTCQRTEIASYTAGTITTVDKLIMSYSSTGSNKAQVVVMPQYTDVTIDAGKTLTIKAWNGTVGGIFAFYYTGTLTVNGTVTLAGKGFRGGAAGTAGSDATGTSGESNPGTGSVTINNNGSGGGGGEAYQDGVGRDHAGGGGGGGHGTVGITGGTQGAPIDGGLGGVVSGSADLTTLVLGSGGGGGGTRNVGSSTAGAGGAGGGILWARGTTLTMGAAGAITGGGNVGSNATGTNCGGGGGGAGGSIKLESQTATLGAGLITAAGGAGGTGDTNGGTGGVGRIHLSYSSSYTGTTTPTLDASTDDSLAVANGYALRLLVSNDGTANETLSYSANLQTGIYQHVAVSWDASASLASFYLDGVLLGTDTGAITSISDNAGTFQVGMSKNGAGSAANFYNGLIDSVRVWNTLRAAGDILLYKNDHIATDSYGLNAYFKFNGDVTDSTANANDLTISGGATYSASVPFAAPTTRQDLDQSATTAGQTYTLPTSISEATTAKKSFTPGKDPQKSISVLLAAKGTGDWTLTVHDQYNIQVASQTITNANLTAGYNEFVFSTPWRIIWNDQYHFHLTSTAADGTVTTGTVDNFSTVSYRTYYQFLVEDTKWHPLAQFLTGLVVGNERYVGTYEASLYTPNKLIFPAGWNVRCFGFWREYLAIGVVRGTSILTEQKGRVYFWDGIAPTYNFFIDIPEGGINALFGTRGILYIFAGYNGDLLAYRGGDYAERIRRIPKLESDEYVDIYPGTVTMWRGLFHFGVAGASDATNIGRGVYSYGALNSKYEDSLSFDFIPSTGNYTTSIGIGMCKVISQKLLIAYKDNLSYGIDYVDMANDPYSTGVLELKIDDANMVWKEKTTLTAIADFLPLESGESVDIGIDLDRTGTYTKLGAVTTADEIKARFLPNYNGGRCREWQMTVDLATTTTTSPKLMGVSIEVDDNEEEQRV